MTLLNPSPTARLGCGAAGALCAAAIAGYARWRAGQSEQTERGSRERHEAAVAGYERSQAQFDADILAVRTAMLAESEVVFETGLPLLRRFAVSTQELANHPLPEALRFIRQLPTLPPLQSPKPYRVSAISPKQEVNLLMSPPQPGQSMKTILANKAVGMSIILVARAQAAAEKADARLTAAREQRAAVERLQARLQAGADNMADTVRRAQDALQQIRRYAAQVRNDYLAPCWRMAAGRNARSELSEGELGDLLNLGVALTVLADFTHREMLL